LVQNYLPGPVTEPYTAVTFPPTNWFMTNADGGAASWSRNATAGFGGAGAAKYDFYNNGVIGDKDELFLPPTNLTGVSTPVLTFDVAYAFYTAVPNNENDKLEVFCSTNCGSTWTSIYMKAGTTLTTAPLTTGAFVPTAAQWRNEVVALPAAASNNASVLVKFVTTSDYGNNLYIDNVNLKQANPTVIKSNLANANSVNVFPNPTKADAYLNINLQEASKVNISVVNALGQIVLQKEADLTFGNNSVKLDTKDFASGLYNVIVETNNGSMVKKLTVSK
jgi:hypothetical protein